MNNNILQSNIILFVTDQNSSTEFYSNILRKKPELFVNGMTEFKISDNLILGLMPIDGIKKILDKEMFVDYNKNNSPKCELYFYVKNIENEYNNAIQSGAKLLSKIELRNWGDRACYFADNDNNIFAFAEKL